MPNIVLVDLDGTLANAEHRHHHIRKTPRDWDSFYAEQEADTPHDEVVAMVNCFSANYLVVILTGRREETREQTEKWLAEQEIVYNMLIMRPVGNRDQDDKWKLEIGSLFGHANIAFVLEDRSRIVEAWRKAGVRCIQVADGNF